MKERYFEGRMQGGEILAKAIALKGIKRVFSLCGGFLNPIYDGCLKNDVEVVGTRNEMEAGFMASAEARLDREPAVVLAEPSGFTNYISAVAEAFHSGDPVVFISVGSIFHRLDHMGFKEMPQHRVVESFTKYSFRVTSGDRLHEFFDKAYEIAANLPTGPVQLSIPINFVFSHYEMGGQKRFFDLASKKVHFPPVHPDDLTLAAGLLKDAKNPVIIAGAGIHQSHAEDSLMSLSGKFRIPYFHSNHLEIRQVDFTQDTYMGLADIHQNGASRLIHEKADVVLCIGTKMDYCLDFGEPPLFNADSTLVCVNPTARELADNHIADHGILADSKIFLDALAQTLECPNLDPRWCDEIRSRRIEDNNKLLQTATSNEIPIHPLQAAVDVMRTLTENDYLVVDGGDAHGWQETALNLSGRQRPQGADDVGSVRPARRRRQFCNGHQDETARFESRPHFGRRVLRPEPGASSGNGDSQGYSDRGRGAQQPGLGHDSKPAESDLGPDLRHRPQGCSLSQDRRGGRRIRRAGREGGRPEACVSAGL